MGTLWHNSHPHVEALTCHALHRTFIGVASAKFLHLGVQRGTISWMEKEGNTITRQNVKIICDAFNVNEHWLRTGEGDMFKPVDEPNILDRLQRELNLNNAEMEIIKTFIELSPEQRRMGIQFIKDFSSKLNTNFAGVLDIPRASEATTVSHSDTSAQQVSFPDSDHVPKARLPIRLLQEAPPGPLASPMMNGSSCRPPAGKKLKHQVNPALQAPKKIGLEANKKANCFLNGNGC